MRMQKQKIFENKLCLKRAISVIDERLLRSLSSFSPTIHALLKKKRKILESCTVASLMEPEQFRKWVNIVLEENYLVDPLPQPSIRLPQQWKDWQGFFVNQYNKSFTLWRKSHVETITKILLLASRSHIR